MASQSSQPAPAAPHKPHVLIVEDDPAVSKLIKTYLEREGYDPAVVETVAGLRAAAEASKVDLVILDIGLPDEDGWSALRWLRARGNVPVIMLTGKSDTVDKVIGLELGADDYLAKPFDLRELLARMHSVQRRADQAQAVAGDAAKEQALTFAEWVLDLSSQQLKSEAGEPVHLTQAEYRILVLLAQNPRRVVTRDQLMDVMAGRDWEPFDRSIDVHISNLRRKLDTSPKAASLIRTVRGTGYMFIPDRGA
ncbi:MAG: response regulator transcription factor [Proteobacteria bacterium]|nr:response regulator transcription factor [Pseudomonadota bacterium]